MPGHAGAGYTWPGEGLHKHNGTTSGLARRSSTVGGKVGRGLGHDNVTQLHQEGLAELHLQVSVKTGEVVWDVHDDDEGGVLCPHLAQSPDQLSSPPL